MTDVLTRAQRSRCMSLIRGKDTKPERIIRSMVSALGYRYRLHVKKLPGTPDLVFVSLRKVIFVHGCFWHRHSCRRAALPATRREWWAAKLAGNRRRDDRNVRKLRSLGWRVLVVWECQLRDCERLSERLIRFLNS